MSVFYYPPLCLPQSKEELKRDMCFWYVNGLRDAMIVLKNADNIERAISVIKDHIEAKMRVHGFTIEE